MSKENEGSNEDDDDEEVNPPTLSHASACQALQTVVTYLEQHPVVPMSTMVILNGLLSHKSETNKNQ